MTCFEVRGPIGGYFVWEPATSGPLLLVAGGSGVVPLDGDAARTARAVGERTPMRLLYSSRTLEDVIYRDELDELAGDGFEVVHTLTRAQPPGWKGYAPANRRRPAARGGLPGRGAPARLRLRLDALRRRGRRRARAARLRPESVRTERFGATG